LHTGFDRLAGERDRVRGASAETPRKQLVSLAVGAVAAAGRCRINSDSNDNARSSR